MYGDRIFEKYGINRDRAGKYKKTRHLGGKQDVFNRDKSTSGLAAASAMARELREIVAPEVDGYVYGKMCANAGHKPAAVALTAENIYGEILAASEVLDDAVTPETGRVLVVSSTV